MKLSIRGVGLIAAFGLCGQYAHAQEAHKLIIGSAHDFTTTGKAGAGGYVGENGVAYLYNYGKCSTCHAAHKPARNQYLWSTKRNLAAGASWTVWDGAAGKVLDGVNDGEYLSETEFAQTGTAMCMSCHDGVTAIGGTTMKLSFRGTWGRNMSDIHPVAHKVAFGTEGWQPDLATGNSAAFANSNVVVDVIGGSSYVGCTSCHSMHSSENSAKILRKGDRCLACHNR